MQVNKQFGIMIYQIPANSSRASELMVSYGKLSIGGYCTIVQHGGVVTQSIFSQILTKYIPYLAR